MSGAGWSGTARMLLAACVLAVALGALPAAGQSDAAFPLRDDVRERLHSLQDLWIEWLTAVQLGEAERASRQVDALVSGGCIISGARVKRSVIFFGTEIERGSTIKDSVILPKVSIGENCRIFRAVIDKACAIPDGTVIGEDLDEDRKRFHVTESGIVLVTPEMLGQHLYVVEKEKLTA